MKIKDSGLAITCANEHMAHVTAADMKRVEIGEGVTAFFGCADKATKNSKLQLVMVIFSKKLFDLESAKNYWNTYQIQYWDKEKDLKKKILVADFIAYTDDGYVTITQKKQTQKDTLGNLVEATNRENRVIDEFEELIGDDISAENVLLAINELSNRCLTTSYEDNAVLAFADYLLDLPTDWEHIVYTWIQDDTPLPAIIKQIQDARERELDEKIFESEKSLDKLQKKNLDVMMNYMDNAIRDVGVVLSFAGKTMSFQYEYGNKMEYTEKREHIRAALASAILFGGALVIRLKEAENKKDIVMEFTVKDGEISIRSKNEVKEGIERKPNGVYRNYSGETYKRMPVILMKRIPDDNAEHQEEYNT